MRPIKVSQTGTGSKVIPVDRFRDTATLQLVVSGTVTWNVKVTADNVYRDPTPYTWFDPPGGAFGSSANGLTVLTLPVMGLQLNVTAGTGTATLTVLQSCSEG
jgi:hypothetical protein